MGSADRAGHRLCTAPLLLAGVLSSTLIAFPSAASAATNPPPPPPSAAKFNPGPSISLGKRTRTTGCVVRGSLPDPRCTPGARFKNADRGHICRPGYTKTVRNVPASLKDRVYAEYAITSHSRATYEVDHLVALELGGSNSISNLFPQAASPIPGFHEKDHVENKAHDDVCTGARGLLATQHSIAKDWTVLYHAYFG